MFMIFFDALIYLMLYVVVFFMFIGLHICLALHMLRFALNG